MEWVEVIMICLKLIHLALAKAIFGHYHIVAEFR